MTLGLPRETREALREFEAFKAELDALRARLEQGASEEGVDPGRDAFSTLHRRLVTLGAGRGAAGRGAVEVDRPYVLACLADEALIHLTAWGGAEGWSETLLERAFYGTRLAGERVIEAAETLVARRDPARRDLAMTIFLALSCGFRGRWRGVDDAGAVGRLRRALFSVATDLDPPDAVEPGVAFAGVHAHTATAGAPTPPRDVERWRMALIGVVVGWLALSHAVWMTGFSDVAALADAVASRADRP